MVDIDAVLTTDEGAAAPGEAIALKRPSTQVAQVWAQFGHGNVAIARTGRGEPASKLVATRSRSAPEPGPKKTGAIAPAAYTGSIGFINGTLSSVSNPHLKVLQNALEDIQS
jgi:hypothetical protein